jgi:methyltransferase (TIGR00027 family)
LKPGRASESAMGSALLRAAHTQQDAGFRLLEDTLSASLLGPADKARPEAVISTWPPEVHRTWRLSHALRTRVAEDIAVDGLADGCRDYVLLGAGLDTFAWRHPRAGDFTVWEYDHPDTQSWKRAALRREGLAVPDNLRFVPIDLSTTPLDDLGTPALATWNWLGVTMYLSRTATETTLRHIAARRPGTTLVVNFAAPSGELDEVATATASAGSAAAAAGDEPLLARCTPDEARSLLYGAGFGTVTLLDENHLRRRWHVGPDFSLVDVIAVATV